MSGKSCRLLSSLWLLATFAAALAAANGLQDAIDHASMVCINDNTPACARSRSSSEYLLFKNECLLRKAQRENLMGRLFDVALRYCMPSCEFTCEAVHRPICGISVNTGERRNFRNRCEMARISCLYKDDWILYKWGICPRGRSEQPQHSVFVAQTPNEQRQPVPCTKVYRPVCAIYAGVKSTFSNECLVNAENIRTSRNWRIVSEGLCGEDSTKMKHNRKYKPKMKPRVDVERNKRSHYKLENPVTEFEMLDDVVQIFAPSTFHTQFISNTGTMEKSYSLPARKPYIASRSKQKKQTTPAKMHAKGSSSKSCVFSNEPVCGSFNGESRSFSNVCALMDYSQSVGNAWTILHEGNCRSCNFKCSSQYQPMCLSRNGIEYTIMNKCYLDRVRCKDPNSTWKFKHHGECALPAEEVSESIVTERSSGSSHIPQMLFAHSQHGNSAITTSRPRSKKRVLRPTIKTTTSAPKGRSRSRKPLRKPIEAEELAYRKQRKIDLAHKQLASAQHNTKPKSHIWKPIGLDKPWSHNKNQLISHKYESEKQLFAKKKYVESANETRTTSRPLLETTTEPPTTTTTTTTTEISTTTPGIETESTTTVPLESTSNEQLLPKVETEVYFMMGDSTTFTPAKLEVVSMVDETTTEPTTIIYASELIEGSAATTDSTDSADSSSDTSIANLDLQDSTEQSLEVSTESPIGEVTTETTTSTQSPSSTTRNLDYVSDEAETLPEASHHTSIYGLDKNSLIMRLLRARSSLRNLVL